MKKLFLSFPLLLLIFGCATQSQYSAKEQNIIESARIALEDVRRALGEQRIQIELIQEQMARSSAPQKERPALNPHLSDLERIEKDFGKNLQLLANHANETRQSLAQFRSQIERIQRDLNAQKNRLNEVTHLKSTLQSIAHQMKGADQKTHIVSSGDTLEKIARKYGTSIQTIQRANNLRGTKIILGQKLLVPSS